MITVTINCATVEELYSILRPQELAAAATTAKAPKAQKTAAAEAVLNAASDSRKPESVKEPQPQTPITAEQLRAAVKDKSANHRETLKKLLSEYGANNVSSLAPEHFAAFLTQVNAL